MSAPSDPAATQSTAPPDPRPCRPYTAAENLQRDVIALLGLPIDVIDEAGAAARIEAAIRDRRKLFLTTPNLNFLIGCQRDPAFAQSVLDSDLSLADGMPLLWLARLLGVPLPERVAGSSLFERLRQTPPGPDVIPIRVYYFGGPPGAAEAAAQRTNADGGRMHCVGWASPGFEPVENLSTPEWLDPIEAAQPDFLVIALGAQKGQAWIQRNRAYLNVPVISHLGAVVNFAAGTVSRAPLWVQRFGLEWVWRIKEEPQLWRRYWNDGLGLLRVLRDRVGPEAWRLWRTRGFFASGSGVETGSEARVEVVESESGVTLRLSGDLLGPVSAEVRAVLVRVAGESRAVRVEVGGGVPVGPRLGGSLLLGGVVLGHLLYS